jgi:hypothetical protein
MITKTHALKAILKLKFCCDTLLKKLIDTNLTQKSLLL